MTAFDDDFAAAESLLDEEFGAAVVYGRDTNELSVTATCQDIEYTIRGKDSREVTEHFRVYVFKTSDLVIGGIRIEPRNGDRVQETINGAVRTFRVVRRNNRPAAELLPGGTRWQVHTVQVDE